VAAVDIAPHEIPSDELQAAIVSAQASLAQACEVAGTGQDPIRLVLAALADTIGIFGKSIRRWERAVADVIVAQDPLSDDDRSKLVKAVEDGAYNATRKEARRMIRTLDSKLVVTIGLAVGAAFIVGGLTAWGAIMATHWGPYSPSAQSAEAWHDLMANNPDPRPAIAGAEIRADHNGRRYYAGLSLWIDPARPPGL
jgi:hypothetical protein